MAAGAAPGPGAGIAQPLRADSQVKPAPRLLTTPGGWATVLADPPWRFANRTGKGTTFALVYLYTRSKQGDI